MLNKCFIKLKFLVKRSLSSFFPLDLDVIYLEMSFYMTFFVRKRLDFFVILTFFAIFWPSFMPEASLLQRKFRFLQNFFSKALVDSQNNNIEHGLEDISKTQRCLWIGEITILKFLPNIKIFYSKRENS